MVVATVSLLSAVMGLYWEVSTHIDDGRDDGPLATPSHYLILIGLLGILSAGWLVSGAAIGRSAWRPSSRGRTSGCGSSGRRICSPRRWRWPCRSRSPAAGWAPSLAVWAPRYVGAALALREAIQPLRRPLSPLRSILC